MANVHEMLNKKSNYIEIMFFMDSLFWSTAWVCYREKNGKECVTGVSILIKNKANVNEKLTKKNVTILHLAAQMGKFMIFL